MIIGFQFKAAKEVLGLTAKEIASAIDVHQGTIVRLGFTKNLELVRCNTKTIFYLKKFFESHGILFPDENTIFLKTDIYPTPTTNQLTRFQLKSARIACELTQEELSSYIKVSSSSISILEKKRNIDYITSTKLDIVQLKKFFEHMGVVFLNDFSVALIKKSIICRSQDLI